MAGLGHRVGPFELIERIASGRRTSLYRALRPDSSRAPRQVAIRMADDPEDAEIAKQIVREYRVLREASDPRIPKVHGYYAGQAALAMSWVEGISLTDAVVAARDGLIGLDVATVTDILIEIATALRHAHNITGLPFPVIHGHLGSQRVMLTSEGEIVLLGLGASPRGTHLGYRSPEQASGAFQDWRSDQWALGAIGIELLLGQRLYEGASEPEQAAIIGDVRPWLGEAEAVAPALARPLRRMLATASGNRFQQNNDLIRELLLARRNIEGLGHRRAVASNVLAMRERLSQQRPAVAPIQPRSGLGDRSGSPAPVPPPTTPTHRRTPVVVVQPPDPSVPQWAPPPNLPVGNPPRWQREPDEPMPVSPVEDPDPPRPLSANPTLAPDVGDTTGPLFASEDPIIGPDPSLESTEVLEPTEMYESVEELEATEYYSEEDDDDGDWSESPLAAILATLQPTEIAGIVLGLLFAVLGLVYLFTRLWS